MQPIDILKYDGRKITYRPEWRKVTGSVTASIVLSQVFYRFQKNGFRPFFKFKEPCGHIDCRDDDSWTEELGMTRKEFDGALKRIGQKVSKNNPPREDILIWYWTDQTNKTYYEINIPYYNLVFTELYGKEKMDFPESTKGDFGKVQKGRSRARVPLNKYIDEQYIDEHTKSAREENHSPNEENSFQKNTPVNNNFEKEKKGSAQKKETDPPEKDEFLEYARDAAAKYRINLDLSVAESKYDGWKLNGWRDGNEKKIKNWRSKVTRNVVYWGKEPGKKENEIPKFRTPEEEFDWFQEQKKNFQ